MKRKYFGTDGIRGRVGKAPMTVDFILKLGWAAGKVLGTISGFVVHVRKLDHADKKQWLKAYL